MAGPEPPQTLFFRVAGSVLAGACAWWALVHLGLASAGPSVPASVLHALLMVFGVFPLFFFGFLFGPGLKWLKVPAPSTATLVPWAALHGLGVLFMAGAAGAADVRWLGGGLLALCIAWCGLLLRLVRALRACQAADTTHYRLFAIASGLGLLGACAEVAATTMGAWAGSLAIARACVWVFIGLTFVAAAGRMVPFVAGTPFRGLDRRYPNVMLKSLSALLLALGLAELVPTARWLVAPVAALAGAALLALSLRWCRVQSLRPRLLRMLFAGFVWLGLALLLSGVAGWLPQRAASAPLHAFTMGFLGSTMLAMLSRFACAQAGRAVVADGLLWGLFLLLQVAAVARVAGPLVAAGAGEGERVALGIAASIWAAVWLVWFVRYGSPAKR